MKTWHARVIRSAIVDSRGRAWSGRPLRTIAKSLFPNRLAQVLYIDAFSRTARVTDQQIGDRDV